MKKYYQIIFLSIIVVAVIILGIRFFSGEDNWICQNGEWVKHGNPSSQKPETKCGEESIVGNYWVCRDGEWIKFGNPSVEKPAGNCGKVMEEELVSPIEDQPQAAEEKNIIVSNPKENATISSPFKIEGRARVFENIVSIRLKDGDGKILFQGTTDAQSPDMGQYGSFSKEIKYTTPETSGTLEVFESSAKDGSEINKVTIPLKFEAAADEGSWVTGNYWLCRDGEWTAFGNPKVPKPAEPCQE